MRAIRLRDQAQHVIAILGVDHAGKKTPRRLVPAGPELGKHGRDAGGLQARELQRQAPRPPA